MNGQMTARPRAAIRVDSPDPAVPSQHNVASLLALYREMSRIRAFETLALEGHRAREFPGYLHASIGQEAVATGVCANLSREDRLTSTHRGHGHAIAKGADPVSMMAELYGRASGSCRGKGGSMHIADFSVGMLGANGIVAGGIPIACGAAQGCASSARPRSWPASSGTARSTAARSWRAQLGRRSTPAHPVRVRGEHLRGVYEGR
jgi:TPP-dependent pyruvate/acetoin dehydrogenase alpha subunit